MAEPEPLRVLRIKFATCKQLFSRRNARRKRLSDSARHSLSSQCGAQLLAASHAPLQYNLFGLWRIIEIAGFSRCFKTYERIDWARFGSVRRLFLRQRFATNGNAWAHCASQLHAMRTVLYRSGRPAQYKCWFNLVFKYNIVSCLRDATLASSHSSCWLSYS